MEYYQDVKSHPKIQKANSAVSKAKEKLAELEAEHNEVESSLPELEEQLKEARVSHQMEDIDTSELSKIEAEYDAACKSEKELSTQLQTQQEVVKRLEERAQIIYEKVYEELNPKVREDQKELVKDMVKALEDLQAANQALEEFQSSIHPNLRFQDLTLDLRRSQFYATGPIRDGSRIDRTIKELKKQV